MATLIKDKDLVACKRCGAIIRYNPNDIRSIIISKDKQGNKTVCNYLLCPNCGDRVCCSMVVRKNNDTN